MDRFRAMETFVRVARAGSFTVAADQLGLSRALVSRHVGMLEDRLGVRLLNRTTRSLNLTDEGRSYLGFCEQMFRDIEGRSAPFCVPAPSRPAPCGWRRRNPSARCICRMPSSPSRARNRSCRCSSFWRMCRSSRPISASAASISRLQFSSARIASLVGDADRGHGLGGVRGAVSLIREGRPTTPSDLVAVSVPGA